MGAARIIITGTGALLAGFASAFGPIDAAPLSFGDLLARPHPAATQRIHYGDAPSQFADLWLPSGGGPYPVAVMIHGGCWRADLPGLDLMAYAAEDLRQHGMAVWNVEYRRIGEPGGGYPGSFEDIGQAFDRLPKLATADRIDLKNVIAVGHSAGGHLALWAAARPRLPKSSALYRDHPLPVKAVVSLAGILDLSLYRAQGPPACGGPRVIDLLVGAGSRSPWDMFTDTSPAEMLPIHVPQAVISGALDPIVPAALGHAYAAKAIAAGDSVQQVTIADAAHFELIDPQSDAFEKIRSMIAQFAR
jgi:acetyl esterase/lipase